MLGMELDKKASGLKERIDALNTALYAELDICKAYWFCCEVCPAMKDEHCMLRETAERLFRDLYKE